MLSSQSRRAFTLIELLLVLAIMVVALAVVAPNIEGMLTARAIQNGVEAVRVELQRGRLEAIRTGQIQAFRCQVGSKEFAMQPWLSANDETEASAGATVIAQTGQAIETSSEPTGISSTVADTSTDQKSLDGNVVFADLQVASDRRAIAEQSGSNPLALAASGESQVVLLYPDGSSSTAHIVLQDARGRRMAVQLRGLTGQVNIVEMPSVTGGT
jgi:prepilin-type N-terminal cleavage/methylation domain-containing protein